MTDQSLIDRIVAGTTYGIISRYYTASIPGPPSSLVIKDLTPAEIQYFLLYWKANTTASELKSISVVVAEEIGPGFASRYRAEPHISMFQYLNNCDDGLIYFASNSDIVDPPPRCAIVFRDSMYLDGTFDRFGSVVNDIIRLTCEVSGYEDRNISLRVSDQIKLVLSTTSPIIPLRTFIRFCYHTTLKIYEHGVLCPPQEIDRIVGQYLSELGYFPDEYWLTDPSAESVKLRLSHNFHHVYLADISGVAVDRSTISYRCHKIHFMDSSGKIYPPDDQRRWRILTEEYSRNPSMSIRKRIPFHIIHQVLANTSIFSPQGENSYSDADEAIPDTDPFAFETEGDHTSTTDDQDQAGVLESDNMNRQPGSLSLEELSKRYRLIIETYDEFGISVLPTEPLTEGFDEGPASILYRVRPGTGVDVKKIQGKADALKLALKLKSDQNIVFMIDEGYVNIDVPKSETDRYFVTATDLWSKWLFSDHILSVPLGLDSLGNVVDINFSSSNSPHLLIAGTTGSGKSEALNTILNGFVNYYNPTQLRLLLVDPKGTELNQFENSPFIEGDIGWDGADALKLLQHAVKQMDLRYARFKEAKQRSLQDYNSSVDSGLRLPWWLLVLDEYADLTSNGEVKKKIEALLKRLAQKARAAGIHVVIATQKPSVDVINSNLRSNLPAQLALRVKSHTESRVIMDEIGAEALNGKGDAFLKCEGRMTRIQCAKTTP